MSVTHSFQAKALQSSSVREVSCPTGEPAIETTTHLTCIAGRYSGCTDGTCNSLVAAPQSAARQQRETSPAVPLLLRGVAWEVRGHLGGEQGIAGLLVSSHDLCRGNRGLPAIRCFATGTELVTKEVISSAMAVSMSAGPSLPLRLQRYGTSRS